MKHANFDFNPHPLLRGSFLQTLAPALFAYQNRTIGHPAQAHRVGLADGDTLVLLENRPESQAARAKETAPSLVFILAPGLASDASTPNLLRLSKMLVARGHAVWRLNHRGTGEGRGLARGIYHAGRAEDLLAVLRYVTAREGEEARIVLVGYSLSGNMALLLAGRHASELPSSLAGVIAASPVLDFAANAPRIAQTARGFYDARFLKALRRTVRQRHATFPELGAAPADLGGTLSEFDALYTAGWAGFPSRDAYYAECSSLPWLPSIRVPAHVIVSRDDPFSQEDPRVFPSNITATVTDGGGHHGFFAKRPGSHGSRFWLDGEIFRTAKRFVECLLPSERRQLDGATAGV